MALELSLTRLSQRFQLWLLGAMTSLALSLIVLWLWDEMITRPLVQLCWVLAAVIVYPLSAWLVCRGFDDEGGFRGWRALLWWPRSD